MKILAIDPGVHGAVAVIDDGAFLSVYDTPTFVEARKGKRHHEYDVPGMTNLLISCGMIELAIIEHVHPFPKNGSIGNFRSGYGFGLWTALCSSAGIPLERVAPRTWKKAMGLSSDKALSIVKAQQLFPRAPITLAMHEGRAEALLIATYAQRHILGEGRKSA